MFTNITVIYMNWNGLVLLQISCLLQKSSNDHIQKLQSLKKSFQHKIQLVDKKVSYTILLSNKFEKFIL